MSAATGRATTGKMVRYATVFTGAAGLAVGFGPTAMAAGAQQGATAAHKLRPDAIQFKGCGNGKNTWVHLLYLSPFGTQDCRQWGDVGASSPSLQIPMSAQCGGNNYGEIGHGHPARYTTFGPGTTYRSLSGRLVYISISRWHGTDECAWPA